MKSLEDKLRDGKGKTADATVLAVEHGVTSYNGADGTGDETTRYRYLLSVQPAAEPAFEATIKIARHKLGGKVLTEGFVAPVYYDPDNHAKVAFDRETVKDRLHAEWVRTTPAAEVAARRELNVRAIARGRFKTDDLQRAKARWGID